MAKPQQDLASNETRRIDGLQLAPLFREPMYALGSKRGYMQSLDLIWTRGKNHPVWDGVSEEEAPGLEGQVVYASERAHSLESTRRKYKALGKSAQDAYLATPREVDARQPADAALALVKEDMADSKWDFLLPLTLIQAYSGDQ